MNNVDKYLKQYRDSAIMHGEYTKIGNYKEANKAYDKILIAYKKLKKINSKLEPLLPFMKDENSSVKIWVACHLLPYYKDRAIALLNEESKKEGILSLTAETILSEWKKGNLK